MKSWWYNRKKWRDVRDEIYKRDGGTCCSCKKVCYDGYNVDHIIPITEESSQKLKYGFDNLQLLCISCHNSKRKDEKEIIRAYETKKNNDIFDIIIGKG